MIYYEEIFWRPVDLEEIEEHLGTEDVELLISDGEGSIYRGKYSFVVEDGKKYRQVEVYSHSGVPTEQVRYYCIAPVGPIPLEEL